MPDARLTGWGWAGLGLAGSTAMMGVGPDVIGDQPPRWWLTFTLAPGHAARLAIFYAGMVALCLAWLGLGWSLRRAPEVRPGRVLLIGALWCAPLVLGPPLFSRDIYSYMAQGELLLLGF